jgi:hypothetical protein
VAIRGGEKIIEIKLIDNFNQAIMYWRLLEDTIIDCRRVYQSIQFQLGGPQRAIF